MKSRLLALVLCCVSLPAYADIADMQNALFLEDMPELKHALRVCTSDADCTVTHGVCGGWIAVGVRSKVAVDGSIREIAKATDCSVNTPATPEPLASCNGAVCNLSNQLRQ